MAWELADLIEKENAGVGEADLPRSHRRGSASDERDRRCAVVGRAEGRTRDERAARQRETGRGVDPCRRERVLPIEGREQARQPAGEHRLAGARWAGQEAVMASRRAHLDGGAADRLAADIGEVGAGRRPGRADDGWDADARPGHIASQTHRPTPATWPRSRTAWRPTSAASDAQSGGTTTARVASASTSGTMPGTRRNEPSSPSSPRNAHPATASAGTSSIATRSPTAIGRSRPAPTLAHP